VPNNKNILFALMGRYGDIILGSFVANMLIDRGYNITWLTIPRYRELVSVVCEKAKIICAEAPPWFAWRTTSTKAMREAYPGYRYYINSQPGSPEHHNRLMKSGVHTAWFVKAISENVIGEKLPDNFLAFAKLKKLKEIKLVASKQLAIISPESISSKSLIDNKMIEKIYREYGNEYRVMILVKDRPDNYHIADGDLSGYTFVECISLLQQASLFIGNDSGLAWASLYNKKCRKIIYHHANRIKQVNTYFNKLDPYARDIILK